MVIFTVSFDKLFNKTLKPYPKSKEPVRNFIDHDLAANPGQGDRYPGFGSDFDVRKIRISLDHYKINKRKGLRLIYIHLPNKNHTIPLFIYKKSMVKSEQKIKAEAIRHLKAILAEISSKE